MTREVDGISDVDAAFLIAAGPASMWQLDTASLAYWHGGSWRAPEAWPFLIAAGAKAVELPAGLKTKPLRFVPVHLARGEEWRVGAVKVTTTPGRPSKLASYATT